MKITNSHHKEILRLIKNLSGQATQHNFSDGYLGNTHPRFAINNPTMRTIAKEWMKEHKQLTATEFEKLLTSLIQGESSTEKMMAGMLMDVSQKAQRKFDPLAFDQWLDHLEGWAEIDTLCTGLYAKTEIPANFKIWSKILVDLSKSKNINKRRASLALLCSPVRKVYDEQMMTVAFENIERLKHEKPILITKAISWLLRSMVKLYKKEVSQFVDDHEESLPKIAIRETRTVLLTGRKTNKD